MKPWTFADAVRAATSRGWLLSRSRGSHYAFKKEGCREDIVIPRHNGHLSTGLQRKIMRQLGMTPRDL